MKSVWLSRVNGSDYEGIPEGTFNFASAGTCVSTTELLPIHHVIFGQSCSFSSGLSSNGAALLAGIQAAFSVINQQGGIHGHRLHVWALDDDYNVTRAIINTQYFLREQVYGLIGYFGSEISKAIAPIAMAENLPYIAPVTGIMSLRERNSFVVNLRASYDDEINAMIHYAASLRGLTRFSIFYQDDAMGEQGITSLVAALDAIGLSLLSNGSYAVNSNDVITGFQSIFPSSLVYSPQVVVVWALGKMAAKFIQLVKSCFSGKTSPLFLCPSVVGESFLSLLGNDFDNIFVSQILPPISDTSHPLVQEFFVAMNQSGLSDQASAFSFEGYVSARLTAAVIDRLRFSMIGLNGTFLDALYANRFFDFGSLEVGPYTRDICNQGIRRVWISSCTNTTYLTVPNALYSFPGECGSNPATTLQQPIVFGLIRLNGSSMDGLYGLAASFLESNQNNEIQGRRLHLVPFYLDANTTSHQLATSLDAFLAQHDFAALVTDIREPIVLTPLFEQALKASQFLFSVHGPLVHSPFSRDRVFVGGTLKDEAFAALQYASQFLERTKVGLVCEIGDVGDEFVRALTMAALEYDCKVVGTLRLQGLTSVISTSLEDGLNSLLNSGVNVLIIGPSRVMANTLIELNRVHFSGPIFLLGSTFDLFVAASVAASGGDVAKHDIFTTQCVPLPSSTSQLTGALALATMQRQFGLSLGVGFDAISSYFTGLFIIEVVKSLGRQRTISPSDIANIIFSTSAFRLDIQLGPFLDSGCHSVSKDPHCECNIGSRSVWLYRYASNLTSFPFEEVLSGRLRFETCEVVPAAKNITNIVATSDQQKIALYVIVIVVILTVFVLCVVAVIIVVVSSRRRRKIAALSLAPKGQVTIVFTDVQDSTKLWDMIPDLMRTALDIHNSVIRAQIERYRGYEVKTQGDSFMVAFESAIAAVSWALEVQEALLEADWPVGLLSQKSCELVTASLSTSSFDGNSMNLDPLVLFKGLRVRVGLHTGRPDIEYNPRTNSVDYFGPMVNCAARIEALGAGGQILASKDTQILVEGLLPDVTFLSLGLFPLKGMSEKQAIVQIFNHRLALRRFPEIDRTKLEAENGQDGQDRPQRCHRCNRPVQCLGCEEQRPLRSRRVAPVGKMRSASMINSPTASFSDDTIEVAPSPRPILQRL